MLQARAPALLLGLILACSARAELPETVALALKKAGIPDSHIGIVVQETDGSALLSHGEQRSFNPASVMKLVTTLAALDTLGPAHTFKTRIWVEGEVKDGVLTGNLTFQGGGDPALTLERLWLLLREIRERGIREIRGDVLLDNTQYELDPIDPAAFDQAPLRPYNAPVAALLASFNTLNLRLGVTEAGITARIDGADAPPVQNQLTAGPGACNGWRERLGMRLEEGRLHLTGQYPIACGEQTHPLNLRSPEATFATQFRTLWRELGGAHEGAIRPCAPALQARLLLEFDSAPLALLVRDTNKYSNNVMARMLFLNLGAQRYGAPATLDKGNRALRAWLEERGLSAPELVLENGAGLSRQERIASATLASLLTWAARQPAYYDFAASLPAIGLEGTQKNRQSDATGRAWLKTGSLNNVRALAGYVLGADGRRRVLVFLVNHPLAGAATAAQDALILWAMKPPQTPPEASGKQ